MAVTYELPAGSDQELFEDAAVALGVFDGVHRGHQALIEGMVRTARATGGRAVVLTFDRDPDERFGGPGFKKLMGDDARIRALDALGADEVVVAPFTDRLASLDPAAFLERAFGNRIVGSVHVGQGFRFGRGAVGNASDLRLWADRSGADVLVYDLEQEGGEPISSTRIRALLAEGDVAGAAALLGRPYELEGVVQRGRGEGADFGIRTANLSVLDGLLAVADGVYAGYALVDGERYKAAVNVGIPPTFQGEATDNVEAHLLGFDGDLYGKPIAVQLVERLRPMRAFGSTDELVATITSDIERVRAHL